MSGNRLELKHRGSCAEEPLFKLADDYSGVRILELDATDASAPATVFETFSPDVLVICGGAIPHSTPLQEQSWEQFSRNWISDVKISLLFSQAVLTIPLASGATIILISSGAALGGSPLSGGYSGSKRTQMFIANYAQKESDRLNLGLRFLALAPGASCQRLHQGHGNIANPGGCGKRSGRVCK
jgi:NAD(P)-dependent dehydrogenase (short-subunit alcohol dehydrogenase family)